jgi:hypothetical protein
MPDKFAMLHKGFAEATLGLFRQYEQLRCGECSTSGDNTFAER